MTEFNNTKLNIFIGTLLIILIIVSTVVYNSKKISQESKHINIYKVIISDATGIKINQPVDIGGYKVGYVSSIEIDGFSPILTLRIDKGIEITSDSTIQVSTPSLLSSAKSVSIVNGINEELLQNNSYFVDSSVGVNIDQLLDMLEMYLNQKNKNEE